MSASAVTRLTEHRTHSYIDRMWVTAGTQIRGAFKRLLDDCQSLDFRQLLEKKFSVHLDKTRPRVRCNPRTPSMSAHLRWR